MQDTVSSILSLLIALFTLLSGTNITSPEVLQTPTSIPNKQIQIFKDVGEPYLYHFGLDETDFEKMKTLGVTHIQSNFDICASDEDVRYFLDMAQQYDLKVILPAGSGEAEWGYACDQEYPPDQKPVWQADAVINWITKWKTHPAVYAWDTSNEAGSVLPNADYEYYLTVEQLGKAYETVKIADPNRPVMIRMNGWFYYDYDENFFRHGNPFGKDVADIVMVNAYANVEDYYDDFVDTVISRANTSIHKIDPDVQIIASIGVWEELPLWHLPTSLEMENDYSALSDKNLLGVAYFKYGAREGDWYLPNYPEVWNQIATFIQPF